MKTKLWARGALSSLPLLLIASAVVATASCSSTVETPSGAGGAPMTAVVGPGPGSTSSDPSTGSFIIDDPDPGILKSLEACKPCHESIYNDWQYSMHARSLTGPVFVAQSNQLFTLDLKDQGSPDPQRFCVQCHSPIASAYAGKQVVLPFKQEGDVPAEALTEGVGCTTCHAYTGLPELGAAGLSDFLDDFDSSGDTYYGPIAPPLETPAHKSVKSGVMATAPETLCVNCHNVFFDTNFDGQIVAGEDLILQNTTFEHDEQYLLQRDEGCIDCHMSKKTNGPVADGPAAPPNAPPSRERHDHRFIGAEFPLDDADNDVQFAERQALLQQAVTMEVTGAQLSNGSQVTFSVKITNTKAGHSLPTGFAFLRQLWVEARVLGALDGAVLATSGVLSAPDKDLCDANTLGDAFAAQVQGCLVQSKNQADPQLVNFQTKLVDDIDQAIVNGVPVAVPSPTAHETWVPFLSGGAVGRSRPSDGKSLAPLAPFESRSFAYSFIIPQQQNGVRLEVALKFRSLPPYFLRTLAQKEPTLAQRLTQNLGKLKPLTVASFTQNL